MNPLNLPGPAFLKFYIVFGAAVIAVGRWFSSRLQENEPPRGTARFAEGSYPKESEAYHIAYLRGGTSEFHQAARVLAEAQAAPEAEATLESTPDASQIKSDLEREGLIFGGAALWRFIWVMQAVLLVLIGMSGAKIGVALSRGRTNIGYLVLLTLVFCVIAVIALRPPKLTRAARAYLAWVERAHDGLLALVNQGRRTTPGEIALCAAIYGLGPLTIEPATRLKSKLRAEAARTGSNSGTSSCGSGGSSCSSGGGGSSCGGGCGGGGCGGCGG